MYSLYRRVFLPSCFVSEIKRLKKMINASNTSTSTNTSAGSVPPQATELGTQEMKQDTAGQKPTAGPMFQTPGSNGTDTTKPKKRGLNLKMIVGVAVLLLVVIGAGAGFYLSQTGQDIRQQAYTQPGTCVPGGGCEYTCTDSHPTSVGINCNLENSDCGTTRQTDICRGKATGANCQLCEKPSGGYACPGDALKDQNCDYSCACPTANQSTCYESGPGHSSGKETPGYDCKNIQKDVIRNGSHVWNCRSDDGKNWEECNPQTQDVACTNFTGTLKTGPITNPDAPLSFNITSSGGNAVTKVDLVAHGNFTPPAMGTGWATMAVDGTPKDGTFTGNVTYNQMVNALVATGHDRQRLLDEGIVFYANVHGPKGFCQGNGTWSGTGEPCTVNAACNGVARLPEPPTGSPHFACTPNQEWSEDGSALSYDIRVSNIEGAGAFESSTIFIQFSGTKTREDQMMIEFLGTPTWASNGANPTCAGTNWCGYFIYRQQTLSGNSFSYTWKTTNGPLVGSNRRSLKDISTFARDVLDRPFRLNIGVNLKMGGVQNNLIGSYRMDIFPDACAEPDATAPICRDVAILDNEDNEIFPNSTPNPFYVGQVLKLRCAADDPDSLISRFEFRVTRPDGKVLEDEINPTGNARISLPFTIEQPGRYTAQCRVCTTDGVCQNYVEITRTGASAAGTESVRE